MATDLLTHLSAEFETALAVRGVALLRDRADAWAASCS